MKSSLRSVCLGLFRVSVFIFLFIGSVWFYLNFPSGLSIFLIITNFVLAVTLTLKWEVQWALILFGLSLVYYLLFTLLPSSSCGSTHIKLGVVTSCECKGVKKSSSFFESSGMDYDRCIGKRIRCYSYDDWFSSSKKAKKEVPCE